MRALIATIIFALQLEPGAAHVNAPVSIEPAAAAPAPPPAQPPPQPPPPAPAPGEPDGLAQEERPLGPYGVLERAGEPPADRVAWGVGAGEVARVVAALGGVLGLLLLLRAAIRRAGGLPGGGRPGGIMNILGRYPVVRGQSLLVLRVGAGRILVIHQSRQSMTTLAEVTDPDEVARLVARIEAGSVRPDRRFQSQLSRMAADDSHGGQIVDLTRRGSRAAGRRAPA